MTASESDSLGTSEPPRVAVVAYAEYASDPRVKIESETLVREGYRVHAFVLRPKEYIPGMRLKGVQLHGIPLSIRRGGRMRYAYQYTMFLTMSSLMILRAHLQHRFDVVHVHTLPDFQVLCVLPLKLSGVSALLDLHESTPELFAARFHRRTDSLWFRLLAVVQRLSCRVVDKVIVACDGVREAIVSRGTPDEKVVTIVTSGDRPLDVPSGNEIVQRLGLPGGRLIVHAGGINSERDLETLLKAVAQLPPEGRPSVVIAGAGELSYTDRLQRLATDLGMGNRVLFVGRLTQEDAHALMALSTIGVVTLESNPHTELAWPIRAGELASLGKVLVVPRLRHLSRVLGDAVRYYDPGNADSLARQMLMAMDEEKAGNPSAVGLSQRLDGLRWNLMRERLLRVYRDLIAIREATQRI